MTPSARRSLAPKIAVGRGFIARIFSAASTPDSKVIPGVRTVSICTLLSLADVVTPFVRSAACGIESGPQTQATCE